MPKNELSTRDQLDVHQRKRLKELVAKIDKWHADGMEIIWPAVEEIRRERLYRETHDTFEAFCRDSWDWGRSYVNRLISANEVKQSLVTIVPKLAESITTEGQLRELTIVPDEQLAEVAEKAAELAGDNPITAKVLKKARVECLGEVPAKTRPKPKAEPAPIDPDKVRAQAMSHLEYGVRAIDDLNAVKRFHDHKKAVSCCQAAMYFLRGEGEAALEMLRGFVK